MVKFPTTYTFLQLVVAMVCKEKSNHKDQHKSKSEWRRETKK